MAQEVYYKTFANGLTLILERMQHVRSAAFNFLVPAGWVYDPPQYAGSASVLAEWITRGAGSRNHRELTLALDNLGLDRSESVGAYHTRFWGATLAANLFPALELYADILRRPHLPDDEFEAVRSLSLQDIQSIEDDPPRRVMLTLRKRHFPDPLGRDRRGTMESVSALTPQIVQSHFRRYFQPKGAILSAAGNINWQELVGHIETLFGDWQPGETPTFSIQEAQKGSEHLEKETTQTNIALAYASVPIGHPDYYVANGAVQVLSGGMSGRLFTEVREKRGLCYSVSASYQSFKECAAIVCYVGTTNDRAQQSLDVTIAELTRLQDGIESDEVERIKAGLKSALIMQEESTSARAGALASDWFFLGRIRMLDEIQKEVDALTPDRIVEHVRRWPAKDPTIVTMGPKPLKLPEPRDV